MKKKFMSRISVSNFIILVLFGLTFYVRTIFPFAEALYNQAYNIEIILFCLLILSLLDFNLLLNFRLRNLNLFDFLIFVSFLLFLISSFYINFNYNNNIFAVIKLFSYFVIIITFFFIFAKQFYLSNELFIKLTDYVIVIGSLLSIYAIINLFFLRIYPIPEYDFTTAGIIAHPNNTAFLYTILFPLLIYKYFIRRISIFWFLTLLTLFSFCLLFTFSRAGYIGVFSTILIITFLRSKTLFIITLILLLFVISTYVLDIAYSKTSSSISRAMLIVTTANMIVHDTSHFLWGYGVYNAIDVFLSEKIYSGNFEDVVTPHNLILLLTIQFGALFTISLLISVVYLYIRVLFIKIKTKSQNLKLKLTVCVTITLGMIIHDLFEGMIGYPEYFLMPIFFVFLGYLYYSVKYYKKIEV